jgi:hypothetical protein
MGGFTEVILYKGTIIGRDRFENLTRDTERYRENLIEITDDDSAWIFTNNYINIKDVIIVDNDDTKRQIITKENDEIEMNVESIESYFYEKWKNPIKNGDENTLENENDIYIATIHWREDFRGKYEPKVKTIRPLKI